MSLHEFANVLMLRPSWWADAACRGTAEQHPEPDSGTFWFPTRGDTVDAQKAVCATCTVIEPCREYALSQVIRVGVFGGMSERERRRERHQRMRERAGLARLADPVRETAPAWVSDEYRSLWKPRRSARSATFGAGTVESKRWARLLAAS